MRRGYAALAVFLPAIAAVTALRLHGLTLSRAELYVDEAQYWFWSLAPDWGYFSKPPLIAWITAGADAVCGAGEACLRAPSALAWGLTALFVFLIADSLYDRRTALFSGLAALLAPGAAFSARIVSTDAPLLTFWSLALLALVRLRGGVDGWGGRAWAVVLGASLGLGLLAKYAMAYFIGCALTAVLIDPPTRRALLSGRGLAALLIAAAIVAPNLLWNLTHGLTTLRHTADNAAGSGLSPDVVEPLVFLLAQAALAGPVVIFGWLTATGDRQTWARPEDRLLLAFSLPILAGLTVMAAVATANANWAATALISVFVLGAAHLARMRVRRTLWAGLALGLAIQIGLIAADARADRLSLAGRAVYARTLGGEALFRAVEAEQARSASGAPIVVETRAHAALLAYYGRDADMRLHVWPPHAGTKANDHFQAVIPLPPDVRAPVLAVSPCGDASRFSGWAKVRALGERLVPAGPGSGRTIHLFLLSEPTGAPQRPAPCP